MPMRIMPYCAVPGCSARAIPTGRGRCEQHAREARRERGSAAAQGYDRAWRATRDAYLEEHPYCEATDPEALQTHRIHGNRATQVHHRRAKRVSNDDSFENLEALCIWCHSRRTREAQLTGNER